jgi:hypothetical protein
MEISLKIKTLENEKPRSTISVDGYLETFPKTILYLIIPFLVGEGSKVKYIIFVYVF